MDNIQGQGNGKEVDGKEDGEMTSGCMQEQHGPKLQEIEMNGIMRRVNLRLDENSLNDVDDDYEMTS